MQIAVSPVRSAQSAASLTATQAISSLTLCSNRAEACKLEDDCQDGSCKLFAETSWPTAGCACVADVMLTRLGIHRQHVSNRAQHQQF